MKINLKHVKPITWEEALSVWEKGEAGLSHWIEHYKKRGFNSWREWRTDSMKAINPERLNWNLYEVMEPLKNVPEFYAGPFMAWIKKYYGEKMVLKFKELGRNQEIQNDARIKEIIAKFPRESTLIGLLNNSDIIIIDGLHRGCALAAANEMNVSINTKLFAICAGFIGELPTLGQSNSPT